MPHLFPFAAKIFAFLANIWDLDLTMSLVGSCIEGLGYFSEFMKWNTTLDKVSFYTFWSVMSMAVLIVKGFFSLERRKNLRPIYAQKLANVEFLIMLLFFFDHLIKLTWFGMKDRKEDEDLPFQIPFTLVISIYLLFDIRTDEASDPSVRHQPIAQPNQISSVAPSGTDPSVDEAMRHQLIVQPNQISSVAPSGTDPSVEEAMHHQPVVPPNQTSSDAVDIESDPLWAEFVKELDQYEKPILALEKELFKKEILMLTRWIESPQAQGDAACTWYAIRSVAYASVSMFREAFEDAKKVVMLKLDWAVGHMTLIDARGSLNAFKNAISRLHQEQIGSMREQGDEACTWYSSRSAANASLSMFSEAFEDAKKVVMLKPDWPEGHMILIDACVSLKAFKNAISHLFQEQGGNSDW